MQHTCDTQESWTQFLEYVKKRCSTTAYGNWLEPIKAIAGTSDEITLEIPNIFVKEYLLSNYKKDLCAFLPVNSKGEPSINFVVITPKIKNKNLTTTSPTVTVDTNIFSKRPYHISLNPNYRFETYLVGPETTFVKSAAEGVSNRPGQSYNPLFIHGGVGLGKTHLLHSIGHRIQETKKKLKLQCITTEAFINDLVDSLRNKSIDQMKRFYRSEIDVLLFDDIQFLQGRLNFEEEICNMLEALYNQNKQIVISSDKPPSQLKLSERLIARMEWGLVAHVPAPDLETRVAILLHKAAQKGLEIPNKVAFFIAEHIYHNVRQLEGAVNKLSAQCRLMNLKITEELVENTLREMLQQAPREKISIDQILKSVAAVFQVRVSDLRGGGRTKTIALPRQVAMYLAYKLINESLQNIGVSFGKTHSTILHACKTIEKRVTEDETLRRQIGLVERNIGA